MPCECDSFFASQPSDDETLFAFFQLLRHRPKVIVVLRSFKEAGLGGPSYTVREAETDLAMKIAGCAWEQWGYSDNREVRWDDVRYDMVVATKNCDLVIAPAWEEGGHEHHNAVAKLAATLPVERGIAYLTYKRGQGRSTDGVEVVPTLFEAEQKRLALNCYQSQIDYEPTRSWFGEDQREFLAGVG